MAEVEEIDAHYKTVLRDIDSALAQVEKATEGLTAAALAGDPVDLNALRAAHAVVVDLHGSVSNMVGAPQGNPVPNTGEVAAPAPAPEPVPVPEPEVKKEGK